MRNIVDKKVIAAVIITTLILSSIFINGSADGTTPGSEADPVVTQSYVELKSEQTKYYIDNLIAKNNEEIQKLKEAMSQLPSGGGGGESFQVYLLNKGKTMLTGVGTEVIVRSGKATAIKGTYGGLSNVTSAKDLNTGDEVALNNLVISSRDDGRGIKAVVDSYVLVKGSYTIK